MVSRRPDPLLVTGVPRSGTTWLAQLLAAARGCALAGREPMNPRSGQYALAGTVTTWVRLRQLGPKQLRIVRRSYSGREPRVYSRYGSRQWAAPWPSTRLVVKDPFALLSLPSLAAATGARPVVVYRHPGAVLASYRRMGWRADVDEVQALDGAPAFSEDAQGSDLTASDGDACAMAYFWSTLHEMALDDLDTMERAVVVSHEELAGGGEAALRVLYDCCGLTWTPNAGRALRGSVTAQQDASTQSLHQRGRAPQQVAQAWRTQLSAAETAYLESCTASVLTRLEARRLRLPDATHDQGRVS